MANAAFGTGFLDLPAELRIAVYEQVLRPEPDIYSISEKPYRDLLSIPERRDEYIPFLGVQLFRTCRQIYHEAQNVLYNSGSRFHIGYKTLQDEWYAFQGCDSCVEVPSDKIQHLTIYIFAAELFSAGSCPHPDHDEIVPKPLTALKDVRLAIVGIYEDLEELSLHMASVSNPAADELIQNAIVRIMEVLPSHVTVEAEQGVQVEERFQHFEFRLDDVYDNFSSRPTKDYIYQIGADTINEAIAALKHRQGSRSFEAAELEEVSDSMQNPPQTPRAPPRTPPKKSTPPQHSVFEQPRTVGNILPKE